VLAALLATATDLTWTAYFETAGKYIEKQVKVNYSVQYMLDSTGGKNIKIFYRGQPHLEIVAFSDVSVVESTAIMRL